MSEERIGSAARPRGKICGLHCLQRKRGGCLGKRRSILETLLQAIQSQQAAAEASGPEHASELFDDFVSIEEDIFQLFSLTSTTENELLIQSQLDESNEKEAGKKTLELLKQKAVVDDEKNEAPLEILLKAISAGEHPENVLPRIGIPNHTYPIFIYNLLPENIDSLIEIYNEMVRASKYLDELGRIK